MGLYLNSLLSSEELEALEKLKKPGKWQPPQNYEWFVTKDNRSCHIFERYVDSAAVMTHLGTFGQKFAQRFMTVLQKTRYTVYGNPSDEVIKALAAFGPVFMTPIGGLGCGLLHQRD